MTTPQTKLSAEIYNSDSTKRLIISPGGTSGTTLTIATNPTANAVLTIPDTSGISANLILSEGMHTVNGNITFAGAVSIPSISGSVSASDAIMGVNSNPVSGNDTGFAGQRYQTNNDSATGDVIGDNADLTGTLQAGSGTSITLPVGFSSTNDYYVGWWIKMTAGPALNQVRQITAYNGTTKVATTAVWTNAPGANTFNMYGGSYIGLVYDESADNFNLGFVPEITSATPTVVKNASITTKTITANSVTATSDTADTITYNNAYEKTLGHGMTHNGNVRVTGNCTIDGNVTISGTLATINSQQLNVRDKFVYQNSRYTTASGLTTGAVSNTLSITSYVLSGSFTAGVSSTSNATVGTVLASGLSAGDLIQISGSTSNDGIYEVVSHSGGVLTVRGQLTSTVEPYSQTQFTAETISGTVNATKVNVSGVEFKSTQDGVNYFIGNNASSMTRKAVAYNTSSPSFAGMTLTGLSSNSGYKALVLDGSNIVRYNSVPSLLAGTYTAGQLLIGNNSGGLTAATLTQGSGVTITNGNGSVTIAGTSTTSATEYTTAGSYTYNIPSNTKFLDIILAGGGGGGGAGQGDNVVAYPGGGGGGAGVVLKLLRVVVGSATTVSVTVGSAGNGGTTIGANGSAGGNSSITINGKTITAYGGGGGAGAGSGGTGAGGGGGSAGTASAGNNSTSRTGGTAGTGAFNSYVPSVAGAAGGTGPAVTDANGVAGSTTYKYTVEATTGGGGGSSSSSNITNAVTISGGEGGESGNKLFAGGASGTSTRVTGRLGGAGGGGGSSGLARGGTGGNGSISSPTSGTDGSLGSGGGGAGTSTTTNVFGTGGNGGAGYCYIIPY